jgi:quercetin dioxygenase-like cupin family protein
MMPEKSITPYEALQFGPIAEGSPVEAALLWGDPAKGPAAVMVRFPEGYSEPWHSHSSTYHAVLIKGEFKSKTKEDSSATKPAYLPGAYTVQPGGDVHAAVNAGKGELVALVYFDGPVDFNLAE